MRRLAPFVLVLVLCAALTSAASAKAHKTLHVTAGHKTGFEREGAVLYRPDDNQQDPADTHKWAGPEAHGSPVCSAHFCVHWTTAGQDASTATYAQQLDNILENEVYPCENGFAPTACAGSPGLGWHDPAPDNGLGGSDATDVYIENLFPDAVYGYTALDPGQDQNPSVPHYAYLVMDNNYDRYGANGGATGIAAERVTAAHEYNHVLQNGYDYLEDSWMFEASAVYMEEKVYPDINDYVSYVDDWVAKTAQPLTQFTGLKPYGSAVWNHWLDHRFGPAAVRDAWAGSTSQGDFAPAAYGSIIEADGGGGFQDEFGRFAAAVAEWEVPGSGFPDRYPDVPRNGTLPVGMQSAPFPLPHTTFAFFDVPIPADAPPTIRLMATLPFGTAGAIALVGRTGPDPTGGTVTSNLTPMPGGGTAAVQLDNPSQYGRITAVVVNSDTSRGGFDAQADDYIFTKDADGVVASMIEPGLPIPTTDGATQVTDHTAVVNATVDPHLIDTNWTVDYGTNVAYGSATRPQALPASTVGAAPVSATVSNLRANTTYHYRVVASNTAGVTAGNDATFKTARDVTPPKLFVTVKKQRLRTASTRGVVYLLRCSERCLGTARVTVKKSVARKLKLPVVLGKSRVALNARPGSKQLRVRLSPRARRLFATRNRGFKAQLVLKLSDAAHNRAARTRTFSLSR